MAAEILSAGGAQVDVYDAMPSVGRKFLMAGKGGLNITHSEPHDVFLARYGKHRADVERMIADFPPAALREWVHTLGIETFIGTSGRVFPHEMKAAPLLRAWLHRLRAAGVRFHVRHQWLGWNGAGGVRFATPQGEVELKPDAVILALGGGSWPKLGSTGAWVDVLAKRGVAITPLAASNCGFDVSWSEFFRNRYAGQPVKPVVASFGGIRRQGECVVTANGVEGGLIYALSAALREEIAAAGKATLHLDLLPRRKPQDLLADLARPRGKNSLANYLRKAAGLDGVKAGLLREVLSPEAFDDPQRLTDTIKALPLVLTAPRPLEEAISTAGGVAFASLDEHLMLTAMPGVFCAGEMLDWDAPTGGYLLTACMASGRTAGKGVLAWLQGLSTKN
jgi:uncharacterized flavoprotein (TIGR03862 family)